MPVDVAWHDDAHNILVYRFRGAWTWDEYFTTLNAGRALMLSRPHVVCILNDMREAASVPENFISKAQFVVATRPDNTGRVVFIAAQTFFRHLIETAQRIVPDFGGNYFCEASEDAALAHLHRWLAAQSSSSSTSAP